MFFPHVDTSREAKEGEEDGKGYYFVSRDKMVELRRGNQFLEHGEYNGNTYGTSIQSVRTVIEQHKMCILDIQPAVSALLFNRQFLYQTSSDLQRSSSILEYIQLIRYYHF